MKFEEEDKAMRDYIQVNRLAYDSLANEYKDRDNTYIDTDQALLSPFFKVIDDNFAQKIRILDLGCGSGLNLRMFSDRGYFSVGIDISTEMIKIAQKTCPSAILINEDFLEYEFDDESFEAILSKASIHNFKKQDAVEALYKIYRMLVPKGVLFIATTLSFKSSEGFYLKKDYFSDLPRYRKLWTPKELEQAIELVGFSIKKTFINKNKTWQKKWFNAICEK